MTGISSILYLAIITIVFASVTATDYCKIKECQKIKEVHTMCKYKSSAPAATCKQWTHQGLNDADRKAIMKTHNELRKKVALGKESRGKNGPQPAAVRMPDLTWDNELETIAQRWTNQCHYGHDDCRDVERFLVGQNVAEASIEGENDSSFDDMIQLWYDEVADFDRNLISNYQDDGNGPEISHYTQMVWADTTKIGCGRIMYIDEEDLTAHLLICNYAPSGNILGKKIYEVKK